MDDDEYRRYGDSTMLEPIIEQQDEEIGLSHSSPASSDHNVSFEKNDHDREEIEKFEALEKKFSSNRHGVRVKFMSSFQDENKNRYNQDEGLSNEQTAVVRIEPCFYIQSSEDQVTKHFYENPTQLNHELNSSLTKTKVLSDKDSLEEESIVIKQKDPLMSKANILQKVDDNMNNIDSILSLSSPNKSILKRSFRKEDEKLKSRSPSPNSTKKKPSSSSNLETNEFPYIAEMTGKQRIQSTSLPIRSLFEPTINIFNDASSINASITSQARRRPSRLQYYIKPYRGEANNPSEAMRKERSRSLSEQRLEQTQHAVSTRWFTFTNQYTQPIGERYNRKQHVSWSPVREYIHRGRNRNGKLSNAKNDRNSSTKTSSLSQTKSLLSSSNPCLSSTSSSIPISVRYRSSKSPMARRDFQDSLFCSTMDSYETASVPDRPLTPITPSSQCSQNEDRENFSCHSYVSDMDSQPKINHQDMLKRYDRLLEKMKVTDEQLQKLSRSWTNNSCLMKSSIKTNHSMKTNIHNTSTLTEETWTFPMILQICLIILVLFNLFVVYFFNEIHHWWNDGLVQTFDVNDHSSKHS